MNAEEKLFELLRYRNILNRRRWRLNRLKEIQAPETIIEIEKELIAQAENKIKELEPKD